MNYVDNSFTLEELREAVDASFQLQPISEVTDSPETKQGSAWPVILILLALLG